MIFSLNIIAGFGCSIGVDMGYNSSHHDSDANTQLPSKSHAACDAENLPASTNDAGTKDDCCSGGIKDLMQLDKSIVYNTLLVNNTHILFILPPGYFLPAKMDIGNDVGPIFKLDLRSSPTIPILESLFSPSRFDLMFIDVHECSCLSINIILNQL